MTCWIPIRTLGERSALPNYSARSRVIIVGQQSARLVVPCADPASGRFGATAARVRAPPLEPMITRPEVECRDGDAHVPSVGDASAHPDDAIIAVDPEMRRLFAVVARIGRGDIPVLLHGETGVGKEVLAEALHRASPRASGPLVKINCAALAPTLLEAELFGHEKGAFTGADRAQPGLFETASGGTMFLDEIGDLPAIAQAAMLRVLESREVLP